MKTAFIALDFHLEHTKSSQFFIDILKAHFSDLHIVKASGAWYDIPRLKPDTILIWQKIFSPKEIDSWRAKNVVFIPMYDACPHTIDFWARYKPYKIFCFCNALYRFLSENGFDALYAQYYKKPCFPFDERKTEESSNASFLPNGTKDAQQETVQQCLGNGAAHRSGASFFYWERSKKITWHTVKRLVAPNACRALHYHYSSNIGEKNADAPGAADVDSYGITFSDWFGTNDEYRHILCNTDVFISPRESEGIGLSFIEALAHGCLVAAFDAPTMNEYITNDVDGYLFTIDDAVTEKANGNQNDDASSALDFSPHTIERLKAQSRTRAIRGYENWQQSIPNIVRFIAKPMPLYRPRASVTTVLYHRTKATLRRLYKKLCKDY